jgi:anti-anti-sigma factor
MRAAHSIKGAARIVGVGAGVAVAHALEDCLVAAQKGEVALTPAGIDVLLRGVDLLTQVAQHLDRPPDGAALDGFLKDVAAVRAGRPPAGGGRQTPEDSATPRADAPRTPGSAIRVSGDGPAKTVTPPGDLDADTAEQLRTVLVSLLDQGVISFRIDLKAVGDIEPVGLALLTAFAGTAARQGRAAELELANARPDVQTLVRLTGLDRAYRLTGTGRD